MESWSSIRTRCHDWFADLLSVLGVGLLFGCIWAIISYDTAIWRWLNENLVVHAPLAALAAITTMGAVYGLLCAGSGRCDDGKCPRTFKGRRHGKSASAGGILSNWIKHMERVGKIHR